MKKLNDIIPRHPAARWMRLFVATALLTIGAVCQFTLATLMLVCTPNTCAAGSPGYGCVRGERICGQQAVWICDGATWRPAQRCSAHGAVCLEVIPGQAYCESAPYSTEPRLELHAPNCVEPAALCRDQASPFEEDALP